MFFHNLIRRVNGLNRSWDGRLLWMGIALVSGAVVYRLTATALAGRLSAGDEAVQEFVLANRFEFLDAIMLFFSWAASEYITPLVLLLLLIMAWHKYRRLILITVAIISTSTLWQIALKHIVGRLRPEPLLYPIWSGAGYPSGHVLTALVLTYLLWRVSPGLGLPRPVTLFLGCLALLYPLLVGISRIYLNCHYLSDVTAGFFLGTGHLGLTFSILGTGWITAANRSRSGL